MKVDVKKMDAVRRELKFEVPRERVSKTFDEVYKELGKVAKIKGYRPGKAPRHILESRHAALAQEEVIKKLIPEVYQEAIEREKLQPVELPEILDIDLKNGVMTFKAHLDIKPEVKIENYKGLKVIRKSSSVTEEEMNRTLDYFKKAKGGDKEVTLDDAFAHSIGFPSLEEFKKSLTRQLEMDKERQNRMDVENQVVEQLLKKAKLVTPQSLVKRQLEHRLSEYRHHLQHQGLSAEDIKKKEEEVLKELQAGVEKDVRVYLVLDKIRELENISIAEKENVALKVMEFLLKEAAWTEEAADSKKK